MTVERRFSRRATLIGGGAVVLAGVGAAGLGYRELASLEGYEAAVAESRAALAAQPAARDLVRFATLAANGHNTQPWLFRIGENRIDILPDRSRRTPVVDPDDHHLFVSLGCAAENLALASAAAGLPCAIGFDAASGAVSVRQQRGAAVASPLFAAIPHRQSTRAVYDGRGVAPEVLRQLAEAAAEPGVSLVLLTDRPRLNHIRDLVVAGNSAQLADAAFLRELKSWMRFTPQRALATGDGLFSVTSGAPVLPEWLAPLLLDQVFTASSENAKYARQMASTAGVAVFVGERADPAHWVRVGRACQRFALQATALGLRHAMINQPVEVARLRPELARLIGAPGVRPDLVMRFGYGAGLPFSARRPVEAVLA